MSGNPLELVDKWPPKGQKQHSQLSVRHDDWIKLLAIEIKKLRSEIASLRLENI